MKKRIEKQGHIVASFLLLLLVCGMIAPVGNELADTEQNVLTDTERVEAHINNEEWAQKVEWAKKIEESIPDALFGGMYFSGDGDLVINLTDINNSAINEELIAQAPFKVSFCEVKHPLSELEAMKDALVPYMVEYNIAMLDANDVTNMLDVVLYECSKRNVRIENLIDQISIVDPDVVNILYTKKDAFNLTIATI